MKTPYDISPGRATVKRLSRRVALRLGRLVRRAHDPRGIRVLTYHRFGRSPLDPCCVAPEAFERQLDWLVDHANVLSPDAFDALMTGGGRVPDRSVLITIDDGHRSVRDHALRALERRGVRAVLFVCASFAEAAEAEADDTTAEFMSWRALRIARDGGHAVASHANTHRSLGRMPFAEAMDDIDRARALLAARLHADDRFFAFPFGTRADFTDEIARALRARGYRYCFSSTHGRCMPLSQPLVMPRIKVENGDAVGMFPGLIGGDMDHWRYIDQTLFRLQQRGRM